MERNMMSGLIRFEAVEEKVIQVRGLQVILDSELAVLYGVETKRINEAVKNNPEKFPDGYLLHLTKDDWSVLKSKFSTSNRGGKVKLPTAFTEKGLYMLATILKGEQAVQTTLAIIETFAKIRELSRNIKTLSGEKDKTRQEGLMQKSGEIIAEILDDDLLTTDTETSVEINFAVLKFKHVVKKKKKQD
jgi:phage regulator Rha-like protein